MTVSELIKQLQTFEKDWGLGATEVVVAPNYESPESDFVPVITIDTVTFATERNASPEEADIVAIVLEIEETKAEKIFRGKTK